ncbi:hypothetical protein A5886_001425 [Enterococcus sp. 8G7_MSG3316]|uniref:Cthe-2314-like HEPN domain-containing protein n=1 Tax=Candidatus Enterococcus testudinis TaxID=1834191 RepID=A0A242A5N5_9ENTE|nr:hypothetical protein [Enterococcus sp. 8G7_MSG3316]OTN76348.1 hypothetical protein A5886_001425 [Enterococcus sp. 8G7_MSG3316]
MEDKEIIFKKDIFSIGVIDENISFFYPYASIVYMLSKQEEIMKRYESARLFLTFTLSVKEKGDLENYFGLDFPNQDPTAKKGLTLTGTSYFYETALIHYNIIIDLTWVMTKTALEYLYTDTPFGQPMNLDTISEVNEAFLILRKIERDVEGPTVDDAWYEYTSSMGQTNMDLCQHVQTFWKSFSNSEIRKDYNFLKHRGTPTYKEIDELKSSKLFEYRFSNGNEIATKPIDVLRQRNLAEGIKNLIDFDNNLLFDYIEILFKLNSKLIDELVSK